MVDIISALSIAVDTLLTNYNLLFVIVGALIGMTFGAIPGLGGVIALTLLIPISFDMDPRPAMLMFGGAMGGVAFGGSISAILLNTPGTAVNVATAFDGHPLAKQGRATEALAISATASGLGALVGLLVLILLLPFVEIIILSFGNVEFFWLAIYGLVTIALVSRGGLLAGLISGGLGIMLALIGMNNVTGVVRYAFGTDYLWDGITLIPVIIGLYAIAEVIKLSRKGGVIAETDIDEIAKSTSGRLRGIKQVLSRPITFLRAAVVGVCIGMIPGAGGTVANFLSYVQIQQTSDNPESFGTGNVEGIIASEGANDAKDGGALLPTVSFGIPGSADMAVLLGAFTLHGLAPGPTMLTQNLDVLFTLILALLVSNVITSIMGLLFATQLAKITQVQVERLIAPILVVSLVGAFAIRNNVLDVALALVFGVLGYVMIAYDYSRIAVILALILSPIAERSFYITLQAYGNPTIFFTRPLSVILILLIIITLILPKLRGIKDMGILGGGQ